MHWWPLGFLIFSSPLQNFHFVLPIKKGLLCFISHYISQLPFFSLSFAGLPPTFSFSLSFTCSIFQICGHDIQSSLYLVVLQLIPLSSVHSKNAFSAFLCFIYTILTHSHKNRSVVSIFSKIANLAVLSDVKIV